ncbi:hypothetical protein P781_09275 [Vibrio mimicus CAIM 1883]|nr:hypothetical protein P781_09275 [Vibrio mimicus CAIM 1883]ERM56005.1 hypothetical protein P780_09260 [Vibrio mimicus CAIM 1882]
MIKAILRNTIRSFMALKQSERLTPLGLFGDLTISRAKTQFAKVRMWKDLQHSLKASEF